MYAISMLSPSFIPADCIVRVPSHAFVPAVLIAPPCFNDSWITCCFMLYSLYEGTMIQRSQIPSELAWCVTQGHTVAFAVFKTAMRSVPASYQYCITVSEITFRHIVVIALSEETTK